MNMAKFRWRDNPETVARLVKTETIKTWKTSDVTLNPNEACAFIEDGNIGEIVSEEVVRNIGGGFGRFLGDFLGRKAKDRRMLFVMTGPMDISVPFAHPLADGQTAKGVAQFRMQFRKADIVKLLNVFANRAPVMDRATLSLLIGQEASHRVIAPILSAVESSQELRGFDVQERFQMRCEKELRPLFQSMGLTMLGSMLITQQTDLERLSALQHSLRAATDVEGAQAEAEVERLAHRESVTLRRIEAEMNIERGKAKGQVMIEVEKELHELRKQEAVWEAELKRDQARAELDAKKMEDKTAMAMSLFNEVQERKKERMRTSNDLQESMMRLAAENGALTPEVMQEFLRQQGGQTEPAAPYPCPSCQQIVQPDWKVCPHCGTGLAQG
ncbi:MAG: hypothetical protein CMA10_01045 [Euryarchaeota archaeon]|nr:hypothetical protein [Euryarchaeota archaeon]|tara:strand:+ start:16258 stop:17415 length:1158 start_codon:yes stop_codon:yes gene_type:complete